MNHLKIKSETMCFSLKSAIKYFLIILLSILLLQSASYSQDTGEEASVSGDKIPLSTMLQPKLGLYPGMVLPIGDLGQSLGIGFGATVFGDIRIPLNVPAWMALRGGLLIGFSFMGTKDSESDASIMMLPIIVFGKIIFPLDFGLRPYLSLGGGISMVILKGDPSNEDLPDASSADGTLDIRFGAGYVHRSLPDIEFILDIGYMMAFETVTGNFLSVSLGVSYRFVSLPGGAESKEAEETPGE